MRRQPQVCCDVRKELVARKTGIEHVRKNDSVLIYKVLQATDDQGFPGSDLSGQDHEPLPGPDPIIKSCQSLLMLGGPIEKGRIRTDLKR
jgi:hypothetical protein